MPLTSTSLHPSRDEHAKETLPAHTSAFSTTASPASKTFLHRTLDTILPPHRTYHGRSRRTVLLIAIPFFVLLLLALILGLGLGLGLHRSNSSPSSLPLPSDKGTFTGDLTFYSPGLGACGVTSSDSDMIVSVSHFVFDAASTGSNPNANPLCKKKIRIVRDYTEIGGGQRSVDVTVVDRCTGCQPTDLDVAPAVFDLLAPADKGRVKGTWAWLD